jgi:hypothetical protein
MSDAKILTLPKRFGWLHHRTLAEVDETERLEALAASDGLDHDQMVRLGVLRQKQLRVMRECGLL